VRLARESVIQRSLKRSPALNANLNSSVGVHRVQPWARLFWFDESTSSGLAQLYRNAQ